MTQYQNQFCSKTKEGLENGDALEGHKVNRLDTECNTQSQEYSVCLLEHLFKTSSCGGVCTTDQKVDYLKY